MSLEEERLEEIKRRLLHGRRKPPSPAVSLVRSAAKMGLTAREAAQAMRDFAKALGKVSSL